MAQLVAEEMRFKLGWNSTSTTDWLRKTTTLKTPLPIDLNKIKMQAMLAFSKNLLINKLKL